MDGLGDCFGARRKTSAKEPELQRVERLVQWFRWLGVALVGLADSRCVGGRRIRPSSMRLRRDIVYAGICDVVVRRAIRIAPISVLTTLGDTIVIAAMCFISGGIESPIFPSFFLSVLRRRSASAWPRPW